MSPAYTGEVALRRSLAARLLSGFPLQAFVSLAALGGLAGLVVAGLLGTLGQDVALLPLQIGILVFWWFGVSAHAAVDDRGVRWRYYRGYAYAWERVEHLRFGSRTVATGQGRYAAPAVYVATAPDNERGIAPAYGCSRRARLEFAAALAAQAAARGIPIEVTGRQWDGLGDVLPASARTSVSPAGRPRARIPQSKARLQTGLFGLAVAVCGVLALVGGITGWDAQGENHTTLIVVGIVLLVLGLPLSLMLRPRP